jgi:hypothetical protein
VQRLAPGDRPAVRPVLEQAVTRGARFSRLHGDEDTSVRDSFRKLRGLMK